MKYDQRPFWMMMVWLLAAFIWLLAIIYDGWSYWQYLNVPVFGFACYEAKKWSQKVIDEYNK